MHIISKRTLREFWEKHSEAQTALDEWYRRLKNSDAVTLVELKQIFPSADLVGRCTVFNVGGNKYRLIAKIDFRRQIVHVRFVLTHSEYDRNKWKANCE